MEKRMSMKTSILWNTWGSLFYLGCQWLLSVLVIRISGFENSGLLTLAMSITNMFYSVAVFGMRTFQVADIQGDYAPGTYFFSRMITGAGAFFFCLFFVVINRYGFVESAAILAYMLFRLVEAFFDVYAGFYQKHWRMDFMGKSMALRGALLLVSCVAALCMTDSLTITFLAMTLSTGAVVIYYDRKKVHALIGGGLRRVPGQTKKLLVCCLPLVIYLFLNAGITSIPRYFLEKFTSNKELGIYAAIAAPTLVVQMASTYIFNPFVAAFAERYHAGDRKGFWKLFSTCMVAVGAVSGVALIGAALFGSFGLKLLIGAKILPYAYLLLPLVLCTVLTAFSWLLCGVLTVVKNFKGLIIGNVVSVFVSIAGSVIFIPYFGMQGTSYVAIAALLLEIGLLFLFLYQSMVPGRNQKG